MFLTRMITPRILRRLVSLIPVVMVASLAGWLLLIEPARAATFTVEQDCSDPPPACFESLADAVTAAQGEAGPHTIVVGPGTFAENAAIAIHIDLTI